MTTNEYLSGDWRQDRKNFLSNVGQVIEDAARRLSTRPVPTSSTPTPPTSTPTPPYANDPSYVTFKGGDARKVADDRVVYVGTDATSPTTRRREATPRDWEDLDDADVVHLYTVFRETVTRIVAEEAPYTKLVFDKAHAVLGGGPECFVVWIEMSGVKGVYSVVVGEEVDEQALRHRVRNGCRRIGAWVMGKEGRRP